MPSAMLLLVKRGFAAAVITNESLRNSILESIRREFPIKACADGEEIMAIGDLTINRAVCKELFGTSEFNEIQENLQKQDIKRRLNLLLYIKSYGTRRRPYSHFVYRIRQEKKERVIVL